MVMMVAKKCCPILAEVAVFSVVDRVEKLAATDFVGDITRQQTVTTSVMCISASAGIHLS